MEKWQIKISKIHCLNKEWPCCYEDPVICNHGNNESGKCIKEKCPIRVKASQPDIEADACMSAGCPNNETGIGNDELCNCKPKSTA